MKDWENIYNSRRMTAVEAVSHIHSGQRVMLGHIAAEPLDTLDALIENCGQLHDVEIMNAFSYGPSLFAQPGMEEHFHYVSMFASATNRECVRSGRGDYIPISVHGMQRIFKFDHRDIDVFMTLASRPDADGYVSIGVSSDFGMELIKKAGLVIAECTPHMPRTYGSTRVHISELDCIVESERDLLQYVPPKPTAEDHAIAGHVASLIEDGSTIQVGVGNVPNIVMGLIRGKKDLGIHTEVLGDWCVDLYECGALTGAAKTVLPGKIVSTSVVGTHRIYDFVNNNPDVQILEAEFVNDSGIIAKNHKMICVNACVEMDLLGQSTAESSDGYQLSGSGGQLNFMEGATMSEDGLGKAILTVKSCYIDRKGVKHSRILPSLKPFSAVTTPRNSIDYLITEYGIARLRYCTAHERARNIISVAHPDFRAGLTAAYEDHFKVKL